MNLSSGCFLDRSGETRWKRREAKQNEPVATSLAAVMDLLQRAAFGHTRRTQVKSKKAHNSFQTFLSSKENTRFPSKRVTAPKASIELNIAPGCQPQGRWSAAPACGFGLGGGEKTEKHRCLCKMTSKKGRHILQRMIPGRKKSLMENNLHRRAGAVAAVRTGRAEQESRSRHCCVTAIARTAERLSRYFRRAGISSRHVSP